MKWEYIKDRKRLNVFGTDAERDIQQVKKLLEEKKIPNGIEAIVYRKSASSQTAMIIRGEPLAKLLTLEEAESSPRVVRPGIKTILRDLNRVNTSNERQGVYAGVVFFSISTKRFMLFTPRGRNQHSYFLGDYPESPEEQPSDIVCRVSVEDTQFEVEPKWLIPLTTVEVNETTFHSFLILVEKEFKPNLSPRLANSIWASAEGLKETRLHESVRAAFEADPHLKKLIEPEPANFDAIIEEILQEQRTRIKAAE